MALNLNADQSRPILLDSDKSWSRVPYQVRFGDTFSDMLSAFHYMLETGAYAKTKGGAEITNDGLFAYAGVNNYIKAGTTYFKDTRVGYNDAINCIWQFNRDDDIVHPIHESDIIKGIGEGRVYAATTELNQSVAWFTLVYLVLLVSQLSLQKLLIVTQPLLATLVSQIVVDLVQAMCSLDSYQQL